MADTATDNLTPEQWKTLDSQLYQGLPLTPMGVKVPPRAPNAAGAAPDVNAPSALPSMPDMNIPNLRAPTPKESIAAGMKQFGTSAKQEGKNQFQEMQPQVTAKPGTPEYEQQQLQKMDFDKLHPWGSDISEHPGTLGKVGHVLSRIGNTAGDILAPGVMLNVPGSDMYNRGERAAHLRNFGEAEENQLKEAQTDTIKEGNEEIPHINPQTGEQETVTRKSLPMVMAAEMRAGATTESAETKANAAKEIAQGKNDTAETIASGKNAAQLLRMGFDENGQPLPDEKLSSQQRAVRDVTQAHTKLQLAQAAYDNAKADPNSPLGKALSAERSLRMAELQQKIEDHGLEKPSGQAASRGSAAEAALQLLPGLEDTIKKNAKEFGPIMGRINKGEIRVGDVSPEVQKAYAQLESFYALQPSVHGFRNAEFVKDFDTFVGNLSTNPDAVIAGLEGLRPTLQTVANEGRTYHKRIVEGAQGAPDANAPSGGPIPSFKDWQASQQK